MMVPPWQPREGRDAKRAVLLALSGARLDPHGSFLRRRPPLLSWGSQVERLETWAAVVRGEQ